MRLAKQRKLAKRIHVSELGVQKACQCSDRPIKIIKIPGTLETREGPCRIFEAKETKIVGKDNCSQSMEVIVNSMQREFDMLCTPSSSASNALNVNKFLINTETGPYHMCKSCNRMLHRKSVRIFHRNAYSIDIFIDVSSFDNEEYICNTCHLKVIKGKIPCQAVCNKLHIDEAPPELEV